jgi:hypothetical protein
MLATSCTPKNNPRIVGRGTAFVAEWFHVKDRKLPNFDWLFAAQASDFCNIIDHDCMKLITALWTE